MKIMQRKRNGLVPIGEAFSDLGGPVQALRETPPPARRGFTRFDQVNGVPTVTVQNRTLRAVLRTP